MKYAGVCRSHTHLQAVDIETEADDPKTAASQIERTMWSHYGARYLARLYRWQDGEYVEVDRKEWDT